MLSVYGRCSICFSVLAQRNCSFCQNRNVLFDRHISTFGLNSECKRVLQAWKFENERRAYLWSLPYLKERLHTLLKEADIIRRPGYLIYIESGGSSRDTRNYQPVADLSRHLETPALPACGMLKKVRTRKQSGAGRKDRFFQLKGSIQLTVKYRPAFYYVILEDVFTTGATASEASRILKKQSGAQVLVLSLFMAE
ncbi:MAG: hypothetical protein CMN76_09365 [Spirochaetaceae bacterium]|nr:hypothetical protein [Spirochaetaceae bacterium]